MSATNQWTTTTSSPTTIEEQQPPMLYNHTCSSFISSSKSDSIVNSANPLCHQDDSNQSSSILFHIFKYLSFRDHLQCSTVLVCKYWFQTLVGIIEELSINRSTLSMTNNSEQDNPCTFLQVTPSSPTSNNSSNGSSNSSSNNIVVSNNNNNTTLIRELCEENTMIEEIEKLSSIILFEKLKRLELDKLGDAFSFELIHYMIYNLKELEEIQLSECTLLKGRLTRRLKPSSIQEQPKTTKRKSIFSIFKRNKSSTAQQQQQQQTNTTDGTGNNNQLSLSSSSLTIMDQQIESIRDDYRRDSILQICIEEDTSSTFSNVTTLNLFKCKLNDEIYRFFMEKLANLKVFKLIQCTGLSSIELTTESSDLSHIEIDFESNPPSLTLDFNCKRLTDSLTYLSINRVHAFNFEKFMERCIQLKTLEIMSYFDEKFTKQMETIENLMIEPYCCANFDNIRDFLPNLTLLHLQNVKYDLGNIFPFFPKLREVRVNFLHDDAVRSENLEELIVLGDTSVECTIDCPNLKILKIQKINNKSFSNKFEKLTHLDFSSSIQINNQLLERMLQSSPNLKTLILSDCPNISSFKIMNNPQIENLILSGTGINDEGFGNIISQCKNLKTVNISRCSSLKNPDKTLQHFCTIAQLITTTTN